MTSMMLFMRYSDFGASLGHRIWILSHDTGPIGFEPNRRICVLQEEMDIQKTCGPQRPLQSGEYILYV